MYHCKCAHCGDKKYYQQQTKYCVKHSHLYKANNRNRFVFTFNIYDYGEMFDLKLLSTIGWRNTKTNPNGMTRDHRVSVNEAIRNNYDPYYIKHPINCELMLFNDNNKKNTKSSITYTELVKLVDAFENGGPGGI